MRTEVPSDRSRDHYRVEITEQMVSAGAASAAILGQEIEEMQLDLFLNNRRTILNNLADEHLRKLEREEAVCWIPVWGWLKGFFTLGPESGGTRAFDGECLRTRKSPEKSAPCLWFELLRHAEHVRTGMRDDGELVRVRRTMKELSPVMFGKYMEKIRK